MPKKTPRLPKVWKYKYFYSALFTLLAAAYMALALIPKPDNQILKHFQLSTSSYYWIVVPISIFIVLIWITGLFGALIFKSYSNLIKQSRDGGALTVISNGLLIFVLSQPLVSSLNSFANLNSRHHPDLMPALTITTNYIALGLTIAAFITIAVGAENLSKLAAKRIASWPQSVWVLGFIVVSCLYSYFIVIQPIHTPLAARSYYLPSWLLITSIAIPYLAAWYFGMNAAYKIAVFKSNIPGWLYKSALSYLAAGIAMVVVSSVATRLITTISSKLTQLKLTPVLFIVLGLLAIDAIGFILIAIGARKLRRIEEV